jgi:hypothetical protein
MEEILEAMPNIGDVSVTRTPVNLGGNNGGFSWFVTFLRDADAPCADKEYNTGLCMSPGDVPRISSAVDGSDLTDTTKLPALACRGRWTASAPTRAR